MIAEDLGVSTSAIRTCTTGSPESDRDWKSAWAQIRRHEELLRLHGEFAPTGRWS